MRERRTYRGTAGYIMAPNAPAEAGAPVGRERRITGVNGFLKWHYFTASEVRSYTVTRDAQGRWTVRCFLLNPDAFKLAQRPLRFVAPHETGEWRWMVESLAVTDAACTATLGPLLP